MAEAEERIQKQGGDRGKTPSEGVLIVDPREHFAKLFGIGENFAGMARAGRGRIMPEPRSQAGA